MLFYVWLTALGYLSPQHFPPVIPPPLITTIYNESIYYNKYNIFLTWESLLKIADMCIIHMSAMVSYQCHISHDRHTGLK